jgi:hypothetical protein
VGVVVELAAASGVVPIDRSAGVPARGVTLGVTAGVTAGVPAVGPGAGAGLLVEGPGLPEQSAPKSGHVTPEK